MTAEQNLINRIDGLNSNAKPNPAIQNRRLYTGFAMAQIRKSFLRIGWHHTTVGRCAARYVKLTGCSQREASSIFNITDSTTSVGMKSINCEA